jgi:hypothetical protein
MDEKKAPCMRAPYRGHDLGTHICCFVLLITLTFFPFFHSLLSSLIFLLPESILF